MHPDLNNHTLWQQILTEFHDDVSGDDDVYLCCRSATFKQLWSRQDLRFALVDAVVELGLERHLYTKVPTHPHSPLFMSNYVNRDEALQLRLELIEYFHTKTTPLPSPSGTE